MLGSTRRREVPFDKTCAGNQGNVVQVVYLELEIKAWLGTRLDQQASTLVLERDAGHTRRAFGTVKVSVWAFKAAAMALVRPHQRSASHRHRL